MRVGLFLLFIGSLFLCALSVFADGVAAPVVSVPLAPAAPVVASLISAKLVGQIALVLGILNVLLSAAQNGAALLHKNLPPQVQWASNAILKALQWLGSNPSL